MNHEEETTMAACMLASLQSFALGKLLFQDSVGGALTHLHLLLST